MNHLADEVEALVTMMVATPWPTTPNEYAQWAKQVGLPPSGEPHLEMDEATPRSTHFFAPGHPWNISWHYFQGEFVGVSLFPGDDLTPHELLEFARELRDRFDSRWAAVEWIEMRPPLTGFTSYWLPGECMVDLYWHEPQIDPLGYAHSGSVQLAVSHRMRERAEDDAATEHQHQ